MGILTKHVGNVNSTGGGFCCFFFNIVLIERKLCENKEKNTNDLLQISRPNDKGDLKN